MRIVTDTLLGHPKVKSHDVSGLPEFSIQVDSAKSVLKAIEYELKLDNLQSLSRLVNKLPPSDIEHWGELGRRLERDGRRISFEIFPHSCLI